MPGLLPESRCIADSVFRPTQTAFHVASGKALRSSELSCRTKSCIADVAWVNVFGRLDLGPKLK